MPSQFVLVIELAANWQAFASLICHAFGPFRPFVGVKAYTHLSSPRESNETCSSKHGFNPFAHLK